MKTHPAHDAQAIRAALAEAYVFAGATPEELDALARVTEWASHSGQEVILREGEPSDSIFVLVKGKLAVKERISGDMELVIARITPGDLVGELGYVESKGASATVRTDGPTNLARLSYVGLKDVFRNHPGLETRFLRELVRILADRLRSSNGHIRSALLGSSVTRL